MAKHAEIECRNCGGPLGASSLICIYCGSRTALGAQLPAGSTKAELLDELERLDLAWEREQSQNQDRPRRLGGAFSASPLLAFLLLPAMFLFVFLASRGGGRTLGIFLVCALIAIGATFIGKGPPARRPAPFEEELTEATYQRRRAELLQQLESET